VENGLEIPTEISELTTGRRKTLTDQPGDSSAGETNSFHTSIKFLLGIAIAKYGLPPDYSGEERTSVIEEMVSDIQATNLTGDNHTLKRYLLKALDHANAKQVKLRRPTGRPGNRSLRGNPPQT
jgi:hypothetical protein